MMPDSQRNSTESLLLFLAGAVTGAAFMVLSSPEIRKKTSEKLSRTLSTLREETSEILEEEKAGLTESARHLSEEAKTLREAYRAGWNAFRESLAREEEGEPREGTPPS
ncbi:YtxH domain-containing protein [Leptospirillum ferriphilum]|jgi:gas vesicle protein|nr:YtxH domain-containing protein [Leptospirillum ferriphilum]